MTFLEASLETKYIYKKKEIIFCGSRDRLQHRWGEGNFLQLSMRAAQDKSITTTEVHRQVAEDKASHGLFQMEEWERASFMNPQILPYPLPHMHMPL